MSDVDDQMAAMAGPGKVVALAFEALASDDPTSEAVVALNIAEKLKRRFAAAMKLFVTPTPRMPFTPIRRGDELGEPGRIPIRK